MSTFGDRVRAVRRRAIAAGMRLLSEEEIVQGSLSQSTAALPRNLKRLREQRGLSVLELAKASRISQTRIRQLEAFNPLTDPVPLNTTLWTLLCIATALNVGIEALVEEGGEG